MQISHTQDSNSKDREVKALVKANKHIRDIRRFIIFIDNETGTINAKGMQIEVIPVWKWLCR